MNDTDRELKNVVLGLKKELGTYQAISRKFGLSPALYWKIGKGKQRQSYKARLALGLSLPKVEVTPCKCCGRVHQFKTCPRKRPPVDRMAARLDKNTGKLCRERIRQLGYKSITDFWLDFAKEE